MIKTKIMLIKCKTTSNGFAACYIYKSSLGDQRIFVKHADDAADINLLISNHMEPQATLLLSARSDNKIKNIQKG